MAMNTRLARSFLMPTSRPASPTHNARGVNGDRHTHHQRNHHHHQRQQHHQLQNQHQHQEQNRHNSHDAAHRAPSPSQQMAAAPSAVGPKSTTIAHCCSTLAALAGSPTTPDRQRAHNVAPDKHQSPIALMSLNASYRRINEPLKLEYPRVLDNLTLSNTGLFWQVKLPYVLSMQSYLSGAHLASGKRYKLEQFHCHWGPDNEEGGSEHSVDSRRYTAELHFVHFNIDKYHSCAQAARYPDGIAVVAVFLDAQPDAMGHAELEKIANALTRVTTKSSNFSMRHAIRIENLLPANRSYWTYQGSLTTPPFWESVTWFVLKHPIRCSTSQVAKFRQLQTGLYADSAHMLNNHRDTQPLNGRVIYTYDG